jgi:group I intron endonuclease
MEKEFNYVYLTTNLINGKKYVGDHSTNNLDDHYIGSGRPYFNNAKKKYGKENFKKEILKFFPSKQSSFDAQEKYIKEHNTLKPNGYNLSPKGGVGVVECFSEESKEKIKNSLLGIKRSEITKQKMSKPKHTAESKKAIWDTRRNNGNGDFSEEHKKNMQEAAKNRPPMSEQTKRNMSKSRMGNNNRTKNLVKC